jgi:hypothetical protein
MGMLVRGLPHWVGMGRSAKVETLLCYWGVHEYLQIHRYPLLPPQADSAR